MPYSIGLSAYREDITSVKTEQDVAAADWLCNTANKNYLVYADRHGWQLLYWKVGFPCATEIFPYDATLIDSPSYLYFRTWNTQKKTLTFAATYAARQSVSFNDISGLPQLVESGNRIYNTGGAQVLAVKGP